MVILTENRSVETVVAVADRGKAFELLDNRIERLIPLIGDSACSEITLDPRRRAYLQHWQRNEWWLLLSEHGSAASAIAPYGEGDRHADRLYQRSTDGDNDVLITVGREGVGDLWMDSFANFDCRTQPADAQAIGYLLRALGAPAALAAIESA